MSTSELANLVAGNLRPAATQPDAWIIDPNTGQPTAHRPGDDPTIVEEALAGDAAAHRSGWAREAGAQGRSEVLSRFADALEAMADDLAAAEMISPGLIASVAGPIAAGSAHQVRGAIQQLAELGSETSVPGAGSGGPVTLRRDPWGPVVIMPPWNAPTPTAIGKAAAAIAAGCPVIVKVHERAPLSARVWQEAALQADVPGGMLQVIHGGPRTALALAEDPRVRAISMTGGIPAGRAIARAGAAHFARLQLELGGLNPVIILPDADIARTARSLAMGMTKLSGQWCESPGQVFVPPSLHDTLIDALYAELSLLRIGASTDASVDVGPLVDSDHRAMVEGQVRQLEAVGGRARCAGTVVEETFCGVLPAVVTEAPAEAARDEIFGPVLTVHSYQDVDEVIDFVNNRDQGLAGYVFGQDVQAAMATGARLLGGEIKINGTSLFDLSPESHQSFWGSSGIGGHGSRDAFEFFRGYRIVGVDNPDAPI
jgi:phenylacetaldehyde dehydrogenase